MLRKLISVSINIALVCSLVTPLPKAQAQNLLGLPEPGTMVSLSQAYAPALIKGLTVHKDNPFLFDFIIDTGNSHLQGQGLKNESNRLIKYFFAALTIPEKDLWVNLSPYEKDRMIPRALGGTAMGRDLLAQDYMLKQITASLIYPEKNLGKKFWDAVYAKSSLLYGVTNIPVNTFNKVWIVADKASVYEHNQTAFVVSGHLKVMLEEDYLAMQKHAVILSRAKDLKASISSNIIRQIILPALEREVNEGQNFSTLRQIFYSQILATWFKRNLKQALLSQFYADKSTVNGVNLSDPSIKDKIYKRYLEAYKKGAFNFIKDTDMPDGTSSPRKYFSGGYSGILPDLAQASESTARQVLGSISNAAMATVLLKVDGVSNAAMADSKAYQGTSFSVDTEGHLQGSVYNKEFVEWETGMREKYPRKKTIVFDASNTLVSLAEIKNLKNPHARSTYMYIVRPEIVSQIQALKKMGYRVILWTSGNSREMLSPEVSGHFDLIIDKKNIIPSGLQAEDLEIELSNLGRFYESLGYDPDQVETMKSIYRENTTFKDITLLGSGNMLVDDQPHRRLINRHPFKNNFKVYAIGRYDYERPDPEDVVTLADRLDKMINPAMLPSSTGEDEFRDANHRLKGTIFDETFIARERALKQKTIVFDVRDTVAFYKEYTDRTGLVRHNLGSYRIRPGMLEELRKLKKLGYRLVLWTGGSSYAPFYEGTGREIYMKNYFDLIIDQGNTAPGAELQEDFDDQKKALYASLGYSDSDFERIKEAFRNSKKFEEYTEALDKVKRAYAQIGLNDDQIERIINIYKHDPGFKDITLLGYRLIVDDQINDEKIQERAIDQHPLIGEYSYYPITPYNDYSDEPDQPISQEIKTLAEGIDEMVTLRKIAPVSPASHGRNYYTSWTLSVDGVGYLVVYPPQGGKPIVMKKRGFAIKEGDYSIDPNNGHIIAYFSNEREGIIQYFDGQKIQEFNAGLLDPSTRFELKGKVLHWYGPLTEINKLGSLLLEGLGLRDEKNGFYYEKDTKIYLGTEKTSVTNRFGYENHTFSLRAIDVAGILNFNSPSLKLILVKTPSDGLNQYRLLVFESNGNFLISRPLSFSDSVQGIEAETTGQTTSVIFKAERGRVIRSEALEDILGNAVKEGRMNAAVQIEERLVIHIATEIYSAENYLNALLAKGDLGWAETQELSALRGRLLAIKRNLWGLNSADLRVIDRQVSLFNEMRAGPRMRSSFLSQIILLKEVEEDPSTSWIIDKGFELKKLAWKGQTGEAAAGFFIKRINDNEFYQTIIYRRDDGNIAASNTKHVLGAVPEWMEDAKKEMVSFEISRDDKHMSLYAADRTAIVIDLENLSPINQNAAMVARQIDPWMVASIAHRIGLEESRLQKERSSLEQKIRAARIFIDGEIQSNGSHPELNSADLKAIWEQISLNDSFDRNRDDINLRTMVLPGIIFLKEMDENPANQWAKAQGFKMQQLAWNSETGAMAGHFILEPSETRYSHAIFYSQGDTGVVGYKLVAQEALSSWLDMRKEKSLDRTIEWVNDVDETYPHSGVKKITSPHGNYTAVLYPQAGESNVNELRVYDKSNNLILYTRTYSSFGKMSFSEDSQTLITSEGNAEGALGESKGFKFDLRKSKDSSIENLLDDLSSAFPKDESKNFNRINAYRLVAMGFFIREGLSVAEAKLKVEGLEKKIEVPEDEKNPSNYLATRILAAALLPGGADQVNEISKLTPKINSADMIAIAFLIRSGSSLDEAIAQVNAFKEQRLNELGPAILSTSPYITIVPAVQALLKDHEMLGGMVSFFKPLNPKNQWPDAFYLLAAAVLSHDGANADGINSTVMILKDKANNYSGTKKEILSPYGLAPILKILVSVQVNNAMISPNPEEMKKAAATALSVINSGAGEDEFLKEGPNQQEFYFTEEEIGTGDAQEALLINLLNLGYIYTAMPPFSESGPQQFFLFMTRYNQLREYLGRVKVTGVLVDRAMSDSPIPHSNLTQIDNGGIDLKSLDAYMSVTKDANGGVAVKIDPAMIARIEQEGISRAEPMIIHMTVLSSVLPLLGLQADNS